MRGWKLSPSDHSHPRITRYAEPAAEVRTRGRCPRTGSKTDSAHVASTPFIGGSCRPGGPSLGSNHGVLQQHRPGHRPNTADPGRDPAATSATSSSTSDSNRRPSNVTPAPTTAAPRSHHLGRYDPGDPAAATTMSARPTCSARSAAATPVCTTVTAAFSPPASGTSEARAGARSSHPGRRSRRGGPRSARRMHRAT